MLFLIEIVYGLGVDVCNDIVVVKIYDVKDCLNFNLLIVYVFSFVVVWEFCEFNDCVE